MKRTVTHSLAGLALATAITSPAVAQDRFGGEDFGHLRDHLLDAHSMQLFGIATPLQGASTRSVDAATAEAAPLSLVTLAKGLEARVVSSRAGLGANIDMMVLWPVDHPTHLIVCNEQGTGQPGVQRVRLDDGQVETILTGTSSCDPVHATAWGSLVFGEEAGNSGTLLEMINPLNTTNVVYNRTAGTFSGGTGAGNITERPALGHLSYEGVAVYPNGVVYYGDENRPFQGTPGGAYFKFVPSSPWMGGTITDLAQSPLASGSVYGLRLGKRTGNTDYGQGSNTGRGTWVQVMNAYDGDLRAAAAQLELTGYYRPEDVAIDQAALAGDRVRFCGNNTGNEENDRNWGETVCFTDGTVAEAWANTAIPAVQLFNVGSFDIGMADNIAYQPGRGNWVLQTDRDAVDMDDPGYPFNNSIWLCLEDGGDVDELTDGCVRIANLNDLEAESTGGFFSADGSRYYVSVQHNVTGHGTILEVTGWR